MVSLLCLISPQSQVQEENHPSMWAISLGRPTTEIAHFERMGLDGFSSNSLILTTEQAFRGRERDSLLVHAYYHTLARFSFSLLSFTLFITSFSLIFLISCVFLSLFSVLLCSPLFFLLCAQLRPFFILPNVMGFYCFAL